MKREYTEKTERGPVFRGKADEGEWVFGDLAHGGYYSDDTCIRAAIHGGHSLVAVDPSSVGQGSGIPDMNGKQMFVGDLVRTSMMIGPADPIIGRVGFDNGAFGLWWHWAGGDAFHPFCSMIHVEYEIIGNMIDTPEKYENS